MEKQIFAEELQTYEPFTFADADSVLTPALLIDRERVQHNIDTTLRVLGGNAKRWRPHVKTAKLGYVMRMLCAAGVRQFKCATTLELKTACESGAEDVLVAYPLMGANARRALEIAREYPKVRVSVLVEDREQVEQWRGQAVGIFIDVNPGMNRTGIGDENREEIAGLCQAVVAAGLKLRGLHYYDGHMTEADFEQRCAMAHRGYRRLMQVVVELGRAVEEVITAGTPAFACSLSFEGFADAPFIHRVSPGTIVYGDATSLGQLPSKFGYLPAAVVLSRLVSQPATAMITCDAGHKTVSADAGVPTCVVMGHPEITPLRPSEEHLPMKVEGSVVPGRGDFLYLLPKHICPTVNNFDHAVIVSAGKTVAVEPVNARGRERPM
jgi:D-serine deaminase-like pyridoxal phosphate-dependent protein